MDSRVHGLSSCLVACGILVPPPGIEPLSSALQSGFLTTGPSGKSPVISTLNRLGKSKARRLVSGRDSSRVEISCNLTVCSPHFMSQGAHLCSSWRHIFISESRKLWLASSVVRGRMRVCPRRLPSLTSVQGIVWGTLQVEALLLFLFFYCEPRQVTQSLWASVSFLVRNMEHVFLLHLTRQN